MTRTPQQDGTAGEQAIWKLTRRQSRAFVHALLEAAPPNAELQAAYKRYRLYKATVGR